MSYNLKKFEVKIMYHDNLQKWENLPVEFTRESPSHISMATWLQHNFLCFHPEIKEIRFNESGSFQGYYV